MTKNIKEEINFTITTGKTSSTAVLGPLLGQRAIKLNEFREKFTKLTENIKDDTTVSVKLIVLFNKKFEIRLNNVPTTTFIKKTFGLSKCSKQAKHQSSAFVDLIYIY
jgi:ribosomal protein L11